MDSDHNGVLDAVIGGAISGVCIPLGLLFLRWGGIL